MPDEVGVRRRNEVERPVVAPGPVIDPELARLAGALAADAEVLRRHHAEVLRLHGWRRRRICCRRRTQIGGHLMMPMLEPQAPLRCGPLQVHPRVVLAMGHGGGHQRPPCHDLDAVLGEHLPVSLLPARLA